MITVEKMSYSFPDKDLYDDISFTIEEGQHAVLIGSNGCGKSTLVQLLLKPEDYLYDGKITREISLRTGYVSQFVKHEKERSLTVFEYLSEDFRRMEAENERLCEEMGSSDDFEAVYEKYQKGLDLFEAMDGYNYEGNIRKQLDTAGLLELADVPISLISGGEYKLLQIIRQMLMAPDLLVMDEPDVFLDFQNLIGLKQLINSHRGTLLVVTHNRYLLNHCFDKILHLENGELQEFEGNYSQYQLNLLQMKIEMQEAADVEAAWIEVQEKLVEKIRAEATRIANSTKGRQLKARVTYLERLKATRTKEPFVNLRQPKITFPKPCEAMTKLLTVSEYGISFDTPLLSKVNFEIAPGEKVAIVGANGTGKTTMLRELWKSYIGEKQNPAIHFEEQTRVGFLSQLYGDMLKEDLSIAKEMERFGFETEKAAREYLDDYCFEGTSMKKQVGVLSGGEKNLLQLAEIALGDANLLILDEPTSHLDTWSQIALEKAVEDYPGAVLMVSHDFYTVMNCCDSILFVEDGTIRRMSNRAFRKRIYRDHFDKDYLELEQQKKDLESRVSALLQEHKLKEARKACDQLESVVSRLYP